MVSGAKDEACTRRGTMMEQSLGVVSVAPGILRAETGTPHFSPAMIVRAALDMGLSDDGAAALVGRLVDQVHAAEERSR